MAGYMHSLLIQRNKQAKNKLLFQILDTTVCSICQDYMFAPVLTPCGHNYCYSCLCSWFGSSNVSELTCPHCRKSISTQPYLNFSLQQWIQTVLDTLKEAEQGKENFEKLLNNRKESIDKYKKDESFNTLYNGIFSETALAVVDEDDDGIARCSNCHWELDPDFEEGGNVCPHCNSRIRNHITSNGNSVRTDARPQRNGNYDLSEYSEDELEDLEHDMQRSDDAGPAPVIDLEAEDEEYYSSDNDRSRIDRSMELNANKAKMMQLNDREQEELAMDSDLADFIADDDEEEEEEEYSHRHKNRSDDGYDLKEDFSDDEEGYPVDERGERNDYYVSRSNSDVSSNDDSLANDSLLNDSMLDDKLPKRKLQTSFASDSSGTSSEDEIRVEESPVKRRKKVVVADSDDE